jgi:short-subunit dehydrogenase
LITGAGRGIGLSITEAFAKAGSKSIILTGRTESSLTIAKASLENGFPQVQFITATVDVGKPEEVDTLFASLKGKVDAIGEFNRFKKLHRVLICRIL